MLKLLDIILCLNIIDFQITEKKIISEKPLKMIWLIIMELTVYLTL